MRRDPKAVKALTELLSDSDNDVAQAAARSLGSIGTKSAAKALLAALPIVPAVNQVAFCEGLLRYAETAVARGDRKEAIGVYDRLRELQAPHQVRTAALRGAILTRQEAGLPLLKQALHDNDYSQVCAAARTAQEIPGTAVTRLLADELAGLTADRQVLIIQTLAMRGDEAALPALSTAARNGEKPVRVAAIRALAEIGKPSALAVLLELMGDGDREIAQAAEESLASLPGQAVDAAVMNMLANGANPQRITALDLIVRRRMTSAVPALYHGRRRFRRADADRRHEEAG